MQREEKQLELFLDSSMNKLKDLKNAIGQMIQKIGKFTKIIFCLPSLFTSEIFSLIAEYEHETINFPQFLDNFAVISGHVSVLNHLKLSISNPTNFLPARRPLQATLPRLHTSNLPAHSSSTPPQSRCRRTSRHHHRGPTQHLRSRIRARLPAHEERSRHGITHSPLRGKSRRSHQ